MEIVKALAFWFVWMAANARSLWIPGNLHAATLILGPAPGQ
jgi:hypothetical protein